MRVSNLTESSRIYTANVYLIRGDWNTLQDVNTLVDVGRDPAVLEALQSMSTGVGKRTVDQVVLTHSHYDHAELLHTVRQAYSPVVMAFSPFIADVDHVLRCGEAITMGDRVFEVIHTPGHSQDSICLFCEEERTLFCGDTPLHVYDSRESCDPEYILALEKLSEKDVQRVYPGHGRPIEGTANALIRSSVWRLQESGTRWPTRTDEHSPGWTSGLGRRDSR